MYCENVLLTMDKWDLMDHAVRFYKSFFVLSP